MYSAEWQGSGRLGRLTPRTFDLLPTESSHKQRLASGIGILESRSKTVRSVTAPSAFRKIRLAHLLASCPMKILVAGIMHESNPFAATPADRRRFEEGSLASGPAAVAIWKDAHH